MTDARATQSPALALSGGSSAARATQSPALVLSGGSSGARTTQAVALVLTREPSPTRATQAAALTLTSGGSGVRATQAAALVLCLSVPCLTQWAQCWRIERVDGEVFTFTAHDEPIVFRGETYQPCDSLSAGASELGSVLGQVGNVEIAGVITDDAISEADLIGGLFDDARVEAWIVPWGGSGEMPWRLLVGTTGKLGQGRDGYRMEVLTPAAKLQQAALVQVYTPGCRWFKLGDARCTVDLGPLTETGTVSAVATLDASVASDRRIFADSGRTEVDGWFDRGIVTWLTGANAGLQGEVKDFVQATGQFTLWQPMLNPVAIGDTYSVVPGCDRSWDTCVAKFSNGVNYGGYKDVPGIDAISQTPDAKQ